MKNKSTRPPIESLACVESECDLYGQAGQGNLTVRKVYGKDEIRYLLPAQAGMPERVQRTKKDSALEHQGTRGQSGLGSRTLE